MDRYQWAEEGQNLLYLGQEPGDGGHLGWCHVTVETPWRFWTGVQGAVLTREEAGVPPVGVLLAEAEGAVLALGDGATPLIQELHQAASAAVVHPELV